MVVHAAAAPPDAAGHRGSETVPSDVLIEPNADETTHRIPPLHRDSVEHRVVGKLRLVHILAILAVILALMAASVFMGELR